MQYASLKRWRKRGCALYSASFLGQQCSVVAAAVLAAVQCSGSSSISSSISSAVAAAAVLPVLRFRADATAADMHSVRWL